MKRFIKRYAGKDRKRRQGFCLAVISVCFLWLLAFAGNAAFGRDIYRKACRPKPIPEDWSFTIISTGDIMMHSPQTKAGWQAGSKAYDFSFMFEKVAPILREGDLVIGNLETPLAGEANGGFTGYPMFNAPEILAQNLKDAGFSLVSTANNHSLDRRHQGLLATLDHLDEVGLMHTGAYRTPDESERILRFAVKGVKIAVIAATYGTNGLTLPKEYSYAVNYINEAKLVSDIQRAAVEGAQYIIVMLHWGVEYQTSPNRDQTSLAQSLMKAGANLILGNHPHVLQRGEAVHLAELIGNPETYLTQTEAKGDVDPKAGGQELYDAIFPAYKASGKAQNVFVMYSQGNFVSNQEGLERLCSILLKLTIGVDGATGQPYFKEAGYIPIYTQKRNNLGVSKHTVWPLELAMDLLETGGQATFGAQDRIDIPKAWERVLGSQPALDLILLKDTPIWETLSPN